MLSEMIVTQFWSLDSLTSDSFFAYVHVLVAACAT